MLRPESAHASSHISQPREDEPAHGLSDLRVREEDAEEGITGAIVADSEGVDATRLVPDPLLPKSPVFDGAAHDLSDDEGPPSLLRADTR